MIYDKFAESAEWQTLKKLLYSAENSREWCEKACLHLSADIYDFRDIIITANGIHDFTWHNIIQALKSKIEQVENAIRQQDKDNFKQLCNDYKQSN